MKTRKRETSVEPANQAIFSVCASADVVKAAMDASSSIAGAAFVGEFHHYITADTRPEFSATLKTAAGCVALIDFDRDPDLALQTITRLRQLLTRQLNIIAFASTLDMALLLRAMRAGCNEFMTRPVDFTELSASLTKFQTEHAVDSIAAQNRGKVLAFYGAKGGVGATTLAVHLATHLVQRHRKKTLLIDHRHELGHVALYLGLKYSQYHFNELIRNVDRLDAELLNGLVTRHASGLEVLQSPDSCAAPHAGTRQELERVLEFLKREYEYILIDSSIAYRDFLPSILDASDEIYLVSTPDVAALRDLSRQVEHLRLNETAVKKLRIAINRATCDDAVTAQQIEEAVRFPVSISIPNNYLDLVRAINAGEPISFQKKTSFTNQLTKWSNTLVSTTSMADPIVATKRAFAFWR